MSLHASRLLTVGIAAFCVCSITASPDTTARRRFDVLSIDAIAAVTGMSVYTIRDNQIAACYSVFVIEPPDEGLPRPEPAPPPTLEELERARVAQVLRDAIAIHDRQIADLQKNVLMWSVDYGAARERIEEEYEQAVRRVLPDLYPAAQVAPGWPASTRDELNAAVNRALAEAQAPERAAARQGIDERMEYLLRRMTASSRLAVTGPVACPELTGIPVR